MKKPTIVILHGWGHSSQYWQKFVAMMQNHAECICFDLPGFGTQKLLSQSATVPDYAQWVEKKIKDLAGKQKVILIGHSFGGRIAAEIASQNPEWLDKLILYAAPCLYRPSIKTMVLKKITQYIPKSLKRFFTPLNEEYQQAKSSGLGQVFRNAVSYDQTHLLKKITTKTLIIWGDQDAETPVKVGEEIHSHIHSSSLVIIKGGSHNLHLESEYLFYGKINEFIHTN